MSRPNISITFAGGARKTTGSQFLIEARRGEEVVRVLVDCGLSQGERFCESSNTEPFLYDPASLQAVFLTHAHIDHIGLVPKLVREGFRGVLYATEATKALMVPMLEDSVRIITREAKKCGEDAPYTKRDVEEAIRSVTPLRYREKKEVAPGVSVEFYHAGHILGSALVAVDIEGTRVLFTGDLGRTPSFLVPDPEVPEGIDYLVTESVYGDRAHDDPARSVATIESALTRAHQRGGVVLIPSFSLERTQIILKTLDTLFGEKKVPPMPVFLDSPLAIRVTEVYKTHPEFLRLEIAEQLKRDDPFSFPGLTLTYTREEGEGIDEVDPPKVVIAGAGMSHGGRIRNHEATYLPNPKNTLILTGYQVVGSLGRRLEGGTGEVMIDGKKVPVRAKVMRLRGFSAHADRDDLLSFAEKVNPKKVFVVLGEMSASSFLAQRISGFLGIPTYIPERGERIELPVKTAEHSDGGHHYVQTI